MKTFQLKKRLKRNNFEGWYLRITDKSKGINLALIFAYTGYEKDEHAFIQVFDGVNKTNHYERFDKSLFRYGEDFVQIGENYLSLQKVILNVADYEIDVYLEQLDYLHQKSAMGYLANLPLECYQEVIFMHGVVKGTVKIKDKKTSIDGITYMEKTYGRRFPKRWFWVQANHFKKDLSVTLAGGHVPTVLYKKFGFFAILHFNGQEIVFGTYNLSKFKVKDDDNTVTFTLKKKPYELILTVEKSDTVTLKGPTNYGNMILDVEESITATVLLELYKSGVLIERDTSDVTGFEWMFKQ